MRILDDGSCPFHDRLEIRGEGRGPFTVGAAWLVEVFSIESGEFFFVNDQMDLRSATSRFAVYYSPFSIVETITSRLTADVFGTGAFKVFPGLPDEPLMFETDRLEPFKSASDAVEFVRTAADPIPITVNRSPAPLSLAAKKIIDQNYSESFSIASVAKRLDVSHAHLSRQFRHDFHLSPKEYVHHLRAAEARYMLQKGERIIDVSEDVGYGDLTRFYKQFRKRMNSTPGRCRD
jgi:AraC-like DNA-binding protein